MGNEIAKQNTLKVLGLDISSTEKKPFCGLLLARAGLGKTAVLVQFALDCMLQGDKVLHVAIGEGVDKTRNWYDDMLSAMTDGERMDEIPGIMQQRMIMTFKESVFSKVLLEERLDDLVEQDIFRPDCLIIDGYDFEENDHAALKDLCACMQGRGLGMIWFSAVSHRGANKESEGDIPAPGNAVKDLFDNILSISPQGEKVNLALLKSDSSQVDAGFSLQLDPSTLLLIKS